MDNLPRGRRVGEAQHKPETARPAVAPVAMPVNLEPVKTPEKPVEVRSAPAPVAKPKVSENIAPTPSKKVLGVSAFTITEAVIALGIIIYGIYKVASSYF